VGPPRKTEGTGLGLSPTPEAAERIASSHVADHAPGEPTSRIMRRSFPPEASDYADDITDEAVAALQAEADEVLGDVSDWVVIDGYAGR